MNAGDEELRSVRIETESAVIGSVDVPSAIGGAPPRWTFPLGAVAIVATIVMVLLLRPEGGTAADGTQRAAPTTTTTSTTTTTIESIAQATSSNGSESVALPAPIAIPPVTAREVDSPLPLNQIVLRDGGFLALANSSLSSAPPLLRSADGRTWTEATTTTSGVPAGQIEWRGFIKSVDGHALAGRRAADLAAVLTNVFVSQNGESWDLLPTLPEFTGDDFGLTPFMVGNESVIAIGELSAVEASLPVGAEGMVVEATVNCAAGLEGSRLSTQELRFLGTAPDEVQSGGFFAFNGSLGPRFFALDGFRVGVVDRGSATIVLCDDGRVLPSRGPGLVIIDGVTGENLRFPAPSDLADDLREQRTLDILGEVQLIENRTHLIVPLDGVLWAIDEVTSEWIALSNGIGDLGFQTPFSAQWAAADTPGRFYALANDSVTIFDIKSGSSGELVATARVAPIVSDSQEQIVSGFGRVLHANDDLIFYDDGQTVWRVALPV